MANLTVADVMSILDKMLTNKRDMQALTIIANVNRGDLVIQTVFNEEMVPINLQIKPDAGDSVNVPKK